VTATARGRAVPPRSHPALRLSLLVVSVVVTLLALEACLRLFWRVPPIFAEFQQAGMYVAGPGRQPMLAPGYRGALRIDAAATTSVRIDALGLRGEDLGPKRAGEKRLLVLGDSLVFGCGVEAAAALPARLQAALGDLGLPVTVGNGGVPGFGPSHAVERMRLLDRDFGADAFVLCGFLGNDAVDEALPRRVVYAGMMLQGAMADLVEVSWRTRLALRSRLALWLEAVILDEWPSWSPLASWSPAAEDLARIAGLPPESQRGAGLFLDAVDEQASWPPGGPPVLPRLDGHLRDALQRAQQVAAGRPLVFVVLPSSWHCDEDKRVAALQSMGFDAKDFRRGLAQQRWLAVAAAAGVPALDATPIVTAAGAARDLFIADGGHFDPRGNEVVARWLAKELVGRLR
jgi:lysophospholipase L1-like esterase